MIVLEKQKEDERKEREQVFSDQFSEDMKTYKELGHITRKIFCVCVHACVIPCRDIRHKPTFEKNT